MSSVDGVISKLKNSIDSCVYYLKNKGVNITSSSVKLNEIPGYIDRIEIGYTKVTVVLEAAFTTDVYLYDSHYNLIKPDRLSGNTAIWNDFTGMKGSIHFHWGNDFINEDLYSYIGDDDHVIIANWDDRRIIVG